jgi:hypothetical protein
VSAPALVDAEVAVDAVRDDGLPGLELEALAAPLAIVIASSASRSRSSSPRAFDGALLDQAKVGILATALLAPALAVAALAPLRRPHGLAPVRRGSRLLTTSPCPAR